MLKVYLLFKVYLFIYVIGRGIERGGWKTSAGSLPTWLQQPGVGQAEAGNQKLHVGGRGHTPGHLLLFPRDISSRECEAEQRELEQAL